MSIAFAEPLNRSGLRVVYYKDGCCWLPARYRDLKCLLKRRDVANLRHKMSR